MAALRAITSDDSFASSCPHRKLMEHLTSLWGVLVLVALLDGTMRFSELSKKLSGVSEKMLTQTLRTLERDGVLHREVHPVIPPHVEYSLTELGTEAAEAVHVIYQLLGDRQPDFAAAQDAYDERAQ